MDKVQFVDKVDGSHGLIGMDIIRNGKSVVFEPHKKGIWIRITL